MARTPAAPALDLVTLPHAYHRGLGERLDALRSMLPARRRRLGLSFDDHSAPTDPWFDAPPEQQLGADVVVIGGGLAGLSAALAAGRRGERVMLIERRQWLGVDARFFGSVDEEDSPDESVGRLVVALRSLDNVTLLTRAEAFALFEGSVRLNQVEIERGVPTSRVLAVTAPRIVLATGTLERLPVFAGNRLPGVVTARAAFHRADRFGVWIGQRAMLSTAASVAYRVATLGKDAGLAVERIADTRLNPQSRFVEFGKAYGIPLARGVTPQGVAFADRRGALAVRLGHTVEGKIGQVDSFIVDQLIVSAGSQPDLSLWHMAGGTSRWSAERARLEADGVLEGIVLAGAVIGYRNAAACIASGEAAIAELFGKPRADIRDATIDPMFESPDDPTPIAEPDPEAEAGAYLDGGASLALRPTRRMLVRQSLWRRKARWGLGDDARPLGVADVAAGVQLGAIPPDEAAVVAQERCVTPGDVVDAGRLRPIRMPAPEAAPTPPPYLAGRFGAKTSTWVVSPADGRDFDIGCLVFPDADKTDPTQAIGVVFASAPAGRKGGLAVLGKWPVQDGETVFVRDISAAIGAQLVDPLRPIEPERANAGAAPVNAAAAVALLAGTPAIPAASVVPAAAAAPTEVAPAPAAPAAATAVAETADAPPVAEAAPSDEAVAAAPATPTPEAPISDSPSMPAEAAAAPVDLIAAAPDAAPTAAEELPMVAAVESFERTAPPTLAEAVPAALTDAAATAAPERVAEPDQTAPTSETSALPVAEPPADVIVPPPPTETERPEEGAAQPPEMGEPIDGRGLAAGAEEPAPSG
jgi:sarcosine oxidase subunit alpha